MNKYYVRFYDKDLERFSYFSGTIHEGTVILLRTRDLRFAVKLTELEANQVITFYTNLKNSTLEVERINA